MKVGQTYPKSKELKKIIESHDWQLYDVTRPAGVRFEWDELNKERPAGDYIVGHNYLFIPKPEKGQTLKEAYAVTKGLGPSLLVEDREDKRWAILDIDRERYEMGSPVLFTRLVFHDICVAAVTPSTPYLPDPDMVGIEYSYLTDTFEKFFRIVKPEEYGLQTPVPMIDPPAVFN